jgi:hypothetical protein
MIGLRGIIKVVRKVKVVGLCLRGGRGERSSRESQDNACLFTDNQPTMAVILGRVSRH